MPRNPKHIVLERIARIAALYRQGWYQYEIAEDVGVSTAQVSRDLDAIRKEWLDSSIRNFDESRAEELAKIDNLEREYWAAWEKSKSNYNKKSTKRKGKARDAAPDYMEQTDTEVILMGDPRFLAGIQWCINKRCEILGLDAPKKLEHSGHIGKTDDELAAEIEHLRKIVNGSA